MRVAGVLFVCAQGCAATPPNSDPSSSADEGSATTSSTSGGATTFSAATPCESTEDCAAAGGFCVAPFDAGAPTIALGRGPSVCIDECVAELALDRWCSDDAACCDALACSDLDGLCRGTDATSSTGVSTWATVGEDTSSSGEATGETTASDGSGTGSDSSSGSGTSN